MRTIASSDFGATPAQTDLPQPESGPGEVLVRVKAASLNGFDVAVAGGMLQGMMEHRFPVVLGKDFAGTVEQVGDGVTRFAAGDAVFGVVTKPFLGDGSFGEFVVVGDSIGIAHSPDGLDLATAGALGLAGTAALDSVTAVAPTTGDTVLVTGATGGVGAIAIQYLVAAGAVVIATATPGAESDFVRDLGATHVVDYTQDLETQVRAIAPSGVSAALHLAGDPAAVAAVLTDSGRLASTLGFGSDKDARAVAVMASPAPATLDRLAADAASGQLRIPITRTYALADVAQGLADFPAGTLGKHAVTI